MPNGGMCLARSQLAAFELRGPQNPPVSSKMPACSKTRQHTATPQKRLPPMRNTKWSTLRLAVCRARRRWPHKQKRRAPGSKQAGSNQTRPNPPD
jgi:hypothetical protein